MKPVMEIYWDKSNNVLIALDETGQAYFLDDDNLINDDSPLNNVGISISIFLFVNKLSNRGWQKIGEL